jgi:hypothetical protein
MCITKKGHREAMPLFGYLSYQTHVIPPFATRRAGPQHLSHTQYHFRAQCDEHSLFGCLKFIAREPNISAK